MSSRNREFNSLEELTEFLRSEEEEANWQRACRHALGVRKAATACNSLQELELRLLNQELTANRHRVANITEESAKLAALGLLLELEGAT